MSVRPIANIMYLSSSSKLLAVSFIGDSSNVELPRLISMRRGTRRTPRVHLWLLGSFPWDMGLAFFIAMCATQYVLQDSER
jgi:hypothetical protein